MLVHDFCQDETMVCSFYDIDFWINKKHSDERFLEFLFLQ
jgi:hypothetical protein